MSEAIKYLNRSTSSIEEEKIYGDAALRFFYTHPVGKFLEKIISAPFFSYLYGFTQDLSISAKKIPSFIKEFNIPMKSYKKGFYKNREKENSYKSFNDFFIREFVEGERAFSKDQKVLPAFSEARYFGYDSLKSDSSFPVKGSDWLPKDVLSDELWSKYFQDGPALIARLCPVDYHRYHYPDDGKTLTSYTIKGPLHSVNPLALKFNSKILKKNERRVSVLETKNFGKLAFVEVGATCVGKIVQSFDESRNFNRGDEKGYFLFGGSTVIVFGEKGKWKISQDIKENTSKGIEVLVRLGENVGESY